MKKTMKKAAFLSLTLAAFALPANAQHADTRPPATFEGQWFTTLDGCSYSRAGGSWYLIQNPHHIGQPPAHSGCATVL